MGLLIKYHPCTKIQQMKTGPCQWDVHSSKRRKRDSGMGREVKWQRRHWERIFSYLFYMGFGAVEFGIRALCPKADN